MGDTPKPKKRKNKEKQSSLESVSDLDKSLIPLLEANKIDKCAKFEEIIYRIIVYIPVVVTFGFIAMLTIFYVFFFLLPSIQGDFQNNIGISDYWANSQDRDNDQQMAYIFTGIFAFCFINLVLAVCLTICTSPGQIPTGYEWDIPEQLMDADDEDDCTHAGSEYFTNPEIDEDATDPRQPMHFDYRFIRTKAGPIIPPDETASFLRRQAKSKELFVPISFERKKMGGIRMCQRCLQTKPDRTHHCSQCNQCVLKMDHHCPWVANCIGFYNYKFFLNMLFYSSFLSGFIACTAYPVFIAALASEEINPYIQFFIITAWLLITVFTPIISGFFGFHLWLLTRQYTTIEFCEKRRASADSQFKNRSPYNRGCCKNFQTVLGWNFLFWFCPCNRNLDGAGLKFEISDDLKEQAAQQQLEFQQAQTKRGKEEADETPTAS